MAERTEAPTPRRRAEYRRKGQIARSPELSSALVLLTVTLVLGVYGAAVAEQLAGMMQVTLRNPGIADWTVGGITAGVWNTEVTVARLIAPPLLAAMAVGIAANFWQTGFLFTTYPLEPKLDRLNPVAGFRRLFSIRGGVETIKSLLKLAIVGFVAYQMLSDNYWQLMGVTGAGLRPGIRFLTRLGQDITLRVAVLMVLMAGLDYLYQRWSYERAIKMTKQEVLEEVIAAEGQPIIKGRRRREQRRLAMQRMMSRVPKADVVVTNPTHLAIALEYHATTMAAPTVTAKGQRLIAERIVQIARANGVPVIQNIPLAHALFDGVEVGEQIPATLYQAVAEVLAFVYRLRGKM